MSLSTVVQDAFSGRWRFERKITDLRDGEEGRMTGWAAFENKTPKIVLYSAEGKLKMRGETREIAEFHRIEFVTPGRVEVFFDDGELFHHFDPREDGPSAEAWHGGDLYRITYDFHRPWEWRVVLHVTGPEKDYRAETRFTR